MTNPRLATRYAKSLMGLAIEQNQLEAVQADMQFFKAACKTNRDLVVLLQSPVINGDVKKKILAAVTDGKISALTGAFNALLINKGREANLPEIANAFIEQYKTYKNITTVKLTTAVPVNDAFKNDIVSKMRTEAGATVEIETVVDENIIGGFVLQTGDNLVDASIAYDLKAIKKQFMNNDFIYKIR
jgi:F-type H+-transporting ATPase subunit delta